MLDPRVSAMRFARGEKPDAFWQEVMWFWPATGSALRRGAIHLARAGVVWACSAVVGMGLLLLAGCVSPAELAAEDQAMCGGTIDDDNRRGAEECVAARQLRRWQRTNALIGMSESISSSMPTYQPTYSAPPTLAAPSVYVPQPAPHWSETVDYSRHVQPAPRFVPVIPGPATGAGGGGLLSP